MRAFLLLVSFTALLFAEVSGEQVFDAKCASCHVKSISRAETFKMLDKLKAPPMVEVANQLKSHIIIKGDDEDLHRAVVIAFVKHYIENPDIMISFCNPGALDRFGTMPSQKGKLSEEEKQAVAEWLYDFYEGKRFE